MTSIYQQLYDTYGERVLREYEVSCRAFEDAGFSG